MAGAVNSQEGKVTAALDGTDGLLVIEELEVLERGLLEVLVAGPLKGVGPGLVSEPVLSTCQRIVPFKRQEDGTNTYVIVSTCIDKHRNFL